MRQQLAVFDLWYNKYYTGFQVVQDRFKFTTVQIDKLASSPPECWDYWDMPLNPVYVMLGTKLRYFAQ